MQDAEPDIHTCDTVIIELDEFFSELPSSAFKLDFELGFIPWKSGQIEYDSIIAMCIPLSNRVNYIQRTGQDTQPIHQGTS